MSTPAAPTQTTLQNIASSILTTVETAGENLLHSAEQVAINDAAIVVSAAAPIIMGIPGDEVAILRASLAAGKAALDKGETYGQALIAAYEVFYNAEKTEFKTVTVKLLDAFLAAFDPGATTTMKS